MVTDALKGDRIIGMVTLKEGYEGNYEGRPPIYPIGCAGLITDVEQLPDGGFNIVLRGLVKIRVRGEDHSRPYRLATVEAMREVPDEAEKTSIHQQRQRLEVLVTEPGSSPWIPSEMPDEEVVNALAQYAPLDPPEHQTLLEQSVLVRSQALVHLLELKAMSPR
jgi:Lon protease-like protein